jgi:hypothetical protein
VDFYFVIGSKGKWVMVELGCGHSLFKGEFGSAGLREDVWLSHWSLEKRSSDALDLYFTIIPWIFQPVIVFLFPNSLWIHTSLKKPLINQV